MPDCRETRDFIETNIIIGYTVDWDRHQASVQEYIESRSDQVDMYTCARVLKEAEDVVSARRRVAKQAAKLVFQNFDGSVEPFEIDDVVGFVRKELGNNRDPVVDHVIQHIKDNRREYTGLTKVESETELQRVVRKIDTDFNGAIAVVDSIRKRNCSELDCTIFPTSFPDLSGYGVFDNVDAILSGLDRDILMDSYHLTQENEIETIYFVTMDGDLIGNESSLECLLDSIDIESPDSLS